MPSSASSAEPARPAASSEAAAASPAAPLQTVRVAYSSLWGANAVPWTAYEAGIFARHGLDAQLSRQELGDLIGYLQSLR